jgi:hypothetical protein
MLKPMTEEQYSTPGVFMMIFSACSAIWRVRWREAASGNCTPAKMKPWSSSGRKLVGMLLPNSPARTATPARRRMLIALFLMAAPQRETYPSVARPKTRLNQS